MRHAAPPRYEIKLHCAPYHLAQVHAWVRLQPAHWRVTYPPRQVNNIYFDTYDYESLTDNLGGVGIRRKLRLRWYGPCLDTVSGANLELKCKDGMVGWKEMYPLGIAGVDLRSQSWPDMRRAIQKGVDGRADLWLAQFPYPVLINCYQRAYYATPDQTVRLTVDSQLKVYDQRVSSRPNLLHPSPLSDQVIVELKAERQHYPRLLDLLSRFPIRTDRYSKYVQGMLAAPDFDRAEPL